MLIESSYFCVFIQRLEDNLVALYAFPGLIDELDEFIAALAIVVFCACVNGLQVLFVKPYGVG